MESSLLAALACGVGFVFAVCIRALLIVLGPYRTSIYGNLPFDMRVLAFAAALLIGTILVFGMLPALRMSDFHLGEAVAAGQTSIAGKRHTLRLLSVIAATEIAIVIALSSSAALMLKSFWNMRYKELGFASHHLIAATINVNGLRYRDKNRQFTFINRLLQSTAAIPGVESVALTNASEIPPGEGHATNNVKIEGRPIPVDSRHRPLTRQQEVNAAYFHLLHIPLLEGRFIQDSDRYGSPPVVVVGKQFAERYFAHESAIGHRLQTGEGQTENILYTIVGVVGDVKTSGLAAAPEPGVYTPYGQTNGARLRELRDHREFTAASLRHRTRIQKDGSNYRFRTANCRHCHHRRTVERIGIAAAIYGGFAVCFLLHGNPARNRRRLRRHYLPRARPTPRNRRASGSGSAAAGCNFTCRLARHPPYRALWRAWPWRSPATA